MASVESANFNPLHAEHDEVIKSFGCDVAPALETKAVAVPSYSEPLPFSPSSSCWMISIY